MSVSPIEHLQNWMVRHRMETHPSGQVFRDVVDECQCLHQQAALAEERLADCRRAAASIHETLMAVLESCIPLVNAEGWSETEEARRFLLEAMAAYGVTNHP